MINMSGRSLVVILAGLSSVLTAADVPTPFLAQRTSQAPRVFGVPRGGSDNVFPEEEYDVNEFDADTLDEEAALQIDGEFEGDGEDFQETEALEEEEEDVFEEVQDEESFDEEDHIILEEADEKFVEALQEEEPMSQVLEDRMATDDDSSAFVDRMELADAYDEGETTTGGDDVAIAAGGAIVPGGDSDNDDEVEVAEKQAEVPSPEVPTGSEPAEAGMAATEITKEQAAILVKDLKYKRRDVKDMRPDIAALVIAKGASRPLEGMPANWYKEGTSPAVSSARGNAMKIAVALVVVGAGAVILRGDMDLDLNSVSEALAGLGEKVPLALASITATLSSLLPAKKEEKVSAVATTPTTEEPPAPEEEPPAPEVEEEDEKPHSLKPGTTPPPREQPDKTWLDRGITKIENAIKAFFRIEI